MTNSNFTSKNIYSAINEIADKANELQNIILLDMAKQPILTNFISKYNDRSDLPIYIPCVIYKKNVLKYSLFDFDITINYTIYLSKFKGLRDNGVIRINEKELYLSLSLVYIDNQINPEYFTGTIYHELTHIYQYYKSNKQYLTNNIDIYNQIVYILENTNDDNIQKFAYALYLTFKFEQDTILSGLYGIIQERKNFDSINNILYKSDAYRNLKLLQNCIDNIDKYPENIFNIDKKIVYKRLSIAYKRYKQKIRQLTNKLFITVDL